MSLLTWRETSPGVWTAGGYIIQERRGLHWVYRGGDHIATQLFERWAKAFAEADHALRMKEQGK